MKAEDHARLCRNYARSLYRELKVPPVLSTAITGYEDEEKHMVYCHPEDENKDNIKDFDYPHREI